jgi:hypothetical protein
MIVHNPWRNQATLIADTTPVVDSEHGEFKLRNRPTVTTLFGRGSLK